MKLSEAIRIGSSWSKQITGLWKDAGGGTCALGAAYEGTFGTLTLRYFSELEDARNRLVAKYPYLLSTVPFPAADNYCNMNILGFGSLCEVIWRLNDQFGWTREKIADYVEDIENKTGWKSADESPKEVDVYIIEQTPKQYFEEPTWALTTF